MLTRPLELTTLYGKSLKINEILAVLETDVGNFQTLRQLVVSMLNHCGLRQ